MYLREFNVLLGFPSYILTKICDSADATWAGEAVASAKAAQQDWISFEL